MNRMETRCMQMLELFGRFDVLDKNVVTSEMKTSSVTAAKTLKSLARSGYLKEDQSVKPYKYTKLHDKPELLFISENTRKNDGFYALENATENQAHVQDAPRPQLGLTCPICLAKGLKTFPNYAEVISHIFSNHEFDSDRGA